MTWYLNEGYTQGMAKTYFCLCAAGPLPDIVNHSHFPHLTQAWAQNPFHAVLQAAFAICVYLPGKLFAISSKTASSKKRSRLLPQYIFLAPQHCFSSSIVIKFSFMNPLSLSISLLTISPSNIAMIYSKIMRCYFGSGQIMLPIRKQKNSLQHVGSR